LDCRAAFADSSVVVFLGLESKRTEAFVGRLPYIGNYILKALAELDTSLSRWN
jgi:hypothetical protein